MTSIANPPGYRPDIDGLRAIAILSVVLFHAFPRTFPGGFIGVDIFFVISGFLIAGIILRGLEKGDFSFRLFYANRVRRIFPALILVLSCAYVGGWFALMPEEFAQLGKHIAGGVGFSDNLVLWREAGYSDRVSDLKPLMHLWSLGIEEQFYLLFPALLWLLWRWRSHNLVVLGALAGMSFLANLHSLPEDPVATFPGWRALLPMGGALLLIAAGPQALVNRWFLAHPIPVWIGLISYPLYLWHWPLLSYARIIRFDGVPAVWRAGLVAASFVLAWLTYWIIEKPIRFGRKYWSKTTALVAVALLVGFIGFNAFEREGLPFRSGWAFRYPEALRPALVLRFDDDRYFRSGTCHLRVNKGPEGYVPECSAKGETGKPSLFLWGDSHAAQLFPGLREHFPDIRLIQYTAPGCQPILGWDVPGFRRCREVNDYVLEKIRELKPERVLLASRWLGVGEVEKIRNTIRQIKAAGAQEVIVIGPVPRWHPDLVASLFKVYKAAPFDRIPERLKEGLDSEKFDIDRSLAKLAGESGARYISPMTLLCNVEGCLVRPDSEDFAHAVMVFDDSHLTPEGVGYFIRLLKKERLLDVSKSEMLSG